jgi:hypothetical protein
MPQPTPTPPAPEQEPAGAVREAAALLLAGQRGPSPEAAEISAAASRADLWRGTGTLIAALLGVIAGDDGDPLDILAPVLRRLRRAEPDLPADVVANVGGALVAAALGHSPTGWRTRGYLPVGGETPVSALEAYAWAVTGRLLVDLLDHTAGAGTAAELLGQL